jgi:hypothetical protein
MTALRTRISIQLMVVGVAVVAAVIGYQMAQGSVRGERSSTIRLLGDKGNGAAKKAEAPAPAPAPVTETETSTVTTQSQPTTQPPRSCYKSPGNSGPPPRKPDESNKNCPADGSPGGGGGGGGGGGHGHGH